jgi:hypothetical protein
MTYKAKRNQNQLHNIFDETKCYHYLEGFPFDFIYDIAEPLHEKGYKLFAFLHSPLYFCSVSIDYMIKTTPETLDEMAPPHFENLEEGLMRSALHLEEGACEDVCFLLSIELISAHYPPRKRTARVSRIWWEGRITVR